jgi:hypothetical protein
MLKVLAQLREEEHKSAARIAALEEVNRETHAGVCWRMLAYADECWRMLTYAGVC